ncbi:MAG: helix-turn-helix domain-containing protein [Candidatus Hydrogenedentes bacterium]|nr:helix-turn-helix domain-containing protein [Candidatus Hydrogenedentota bacterium]
MNESEVIEVRETRLYGVPEVAAILGVTPTAVREMVNSGELPAKRARPNSRPRVSGAAILAYVRGGR